VEKTFGKKNEVAVWKRWGKNSTGLAVVVIPSRQTLSLLERVVGLAPGSQGVDLSNFICIFSTLKAAEWGGRSHPQPVFFLSYFNLSIPPLCAKLYSKLQSHSCSAGG
jgi:hypothetical protein